MPGRYEQALDAAVTDGVLTPAQADDVRRRAHAHDDRSGRTVRLVSWIGATLVAVGIILFVATNWEDIPDAGRTLLLVAASAAALAGGWRLLTTGHVPLGHALLVVGGAALGGTIFQVANWANLPPDNPLLLGLWFVSLLPIAYAFRSAPVLLEALLVLPFWLGLTLGDADASLHTGLLLFGTTALAVATASYFHGPGLPGFRISLLGFGTVGVLLVGFIATFAAGNMRFEMTWGAQEVVWLIGAVLVIGAGITRRAMERMDWDLAVPGILAAIVLVAALGTNNALVNILYAVLLIGLVLAAVQARSELVLNISLAAFVVEVVGRYIDFLMDENLDASLFFIGGGLLLLASAYAAERLRRRLRPQEGAPDA